MEEYCHQHLPFELYDLEGLSTPMIRLFLTDRSGFQLTKGLLTQYILEKLVLIEQNSTRAFELQAILREFSVAVTECANRQGVLLNQYHAA
jgi:hypothetical protein